MVKDGLGLTTQERAVRVAKIVWDSGKVTTKQAVKATGLTARAARHLLSLLSKELRLFYDPEERAWIRIDE